MSLIHYSRQDYYKNPYGAVPCDTAVLLRCDYTDYNCFPVLYFRYEAFDFCRTFSFKPDKTIIHDGIFTAEYNLNSTVFNNAGLYFYWFSTEKGERTFRKGD